jgi:hypothetical protein
MLRSRRNRRIAVAAAAAIVLIAVSSWLAVARVPSWYRPPHVGAAQYQDVRDDLETAFNQLNLAMQGRQPFEYIVSEDRLNRWIAAREQIWPGLRQYVPRELQWPVVTFRQEGIVVAGVVEIGSVRSVLSVVLSVRAEPDRMVLKLGRCRLGAVPVPHWMVRRFLEAMSRSATPDSPGQPRDLLKELVLENRFDWPNGARRFRILAVDVQPGRLVTTIHPSSARQGRMLWR